MRRVLVTIAISIIHFTLSQTMFSEITIGSLNYQLQMRKILLRMAFIGFLATLVLTTFSLAANAHHGRTEEKLVIFPKGKTEVVLRGRIKSISVTPSYILKARKGQVLSVRLTSNNKNATFAVFNAKDFEATGDDVGIDRRWKDTISSTGDYTVIVSGLTSGYDLLTLELK